MKATIQELKKASKEIESVDKVEPMDKEDNNKDKVSEKEKSSEVAKSVEEEKTIAEKADTDCPSKKQKMYEPTSGDVTSKDSKKRALKILKRTKRERRKKILTNLSVLYQDIFSLWLIKGIK